MIDQSRMLDTMHELLTAYNDHDVNKILECMTEDCVFHAYSGPEPHGRTIVGAEAIADRTRMWFERFPDARWVDGHHSLMAEGRGMTTWTFMGTDAQSGKAVERKGCDLFEFRGEKVAMKDTYQKDTPDEMPESKLKPFVAYETLGMPVGRYVHAMQVNHLLFISGMAPLDNHGTLVASDVAEQTRATLHNMQNVLELAGLGFRHVITETIYLTNVADRFVTHEIRDAFYGDHVPAGTLIGVNELVVPGMKIQIDAVAVIS